ncbi:MAG: hypothetical protein MJE77_02940 [Proteobacteria bacterium]|nr:hypothetical protein [Pseudomonadota bacterium]
MSRFTIVLTGWLVVALIACGWLYRDNHDLREQLAARGSASLAATAAGAGSADQVDRAQAESRAATPRRPISQWLFGADRAARPAVAEEPKKETRQERRTRRQAEITAIFGRLDGESEVEYRERMAPLVKSMLAGPRKRLAEARSAAEKFAHISEEQRAQLDTALEDAYNEVIELANSAVESGELTPYSRNWSGLLGFAGGMGAVLQGTENRIAQILSPDQLRIIYDQGFEWGEYLGVSVPWEELDAPPPPPK